MLFVAHQLSLTLEVVATTITYAYTTVTLASGQQYK